MENANSIWKMDAESAAVLNGQWVKPRGNQVMFLRMSGYKLKEVGEVMGLGKERIRQIQRRYERDCKREMAEPKPRYHEIEVLVPYIDSIKALYE